MPRFQDYRATLLRNTTLFHYDAQLVLGGGFNEVEQFITHMQRTAESIRSNRNLTPEGKRAESTKAGEAIIAEINKWSTKRLAGLDADAAAQRAAIAPQAVKVEPVRHDALTRSLQNFTQQERMVFYSSAPDDLRAEMEAVSVALGPLPTRNGQALEWRPLLDARAVIESMTARAEAKNPKAAAKLREVQEIREMTQTIANIAIADVKDAMALALTA